jgi:adenosylcobinamide kinase / adenosylcobinamide-phosphate guanylyltransferase
MKLYIGGSFQGQAGLAQAETGCAPRDVTRAQALSTPAIDHFHELLRGLTPLEARAFATELMAVNPDCVIVCDEVGMGVVPLEPEGRQWREAVGAAMCLMASRAEQVTRVACGIPVRLRAIASDCVVSDWSGTRTGLTEFPAGNSGRKSG